MPTIGDPARQCQRSSGAAAVLLILAVIVASTALRAQDSPPVDRSLEYRVLDARSGQPFPGVQLLIRINSDDSTGLTDDHGVYVIKKIPTREGNSVFVQIRHAGYAPVSTWWRNEAANSGLPRTYTLKLVPAITIGGVIHDEDGRPITGATVYVRADRNVGNSEGAPHINVFEYPARTDREGRWTCDRIPDDVEYVATRLVHPDYVSDSTYEDTSEPPLEALRTRTAIMVMKRGAVISGTVRDEGAKPIAGARVKLGIDRWGRPEPPATWTDGEGRYRLPVAPGSHVVTVVAEGYAPDLRRLPAVQRSEVSDFVLGLGRVFRGRFVDTQGRPIASVHVAPDTWRGCRTLEDQRLNADADGRFRWASAPADEVLFDMGKAGYMWIRKRPYTASDEEITITLHPYLRVHGTVVDAETGRPIGAFQAVPGIVINEHPHWMYDDAVASRDGRYELTFDDPRTPVVRIESAGYHPAVSRTYRSDEADQVFDVRLRKATTDAGKEKTVAGVVRLPDGAALAGAEVVLVTPRAAPTINNGRLVQRGRSPIVKTGPDGRFALPVPEEDYAIVVIADQGIAERSAAQLGAEPVVRLEPWGRIAGVLRVGPRPAARQSVEVNAEGPSAFPGTAAEVSYLYFATTDDHGAFEFDRVRPGRYQISMTLQLPRGLFTASGQRTSIEVKAGQTVPVVVGGMGRPIIGRLEPPAGIAGRVDWTYGDFELDGSETRFPFNVRPDGAFRVEDVPAGKYRLSVRLAAPPSGNKPVFKLLGQALRPFEVPDMPRGRSDEPLDLGSIALTGPSDSR
jgi:protocatechuate 3,4-dioxygenase beta subunit